MATRAAVSVAQLQARRQRPWPLRSDGTWLWLATAALLSLSLCASSSLLSVSARAVPTSVVGSVNVIYLATMQQSLQAYQVSTPEFNRTTFTPTSGLDAGAATLTDGLADFAVTTSSVPDALAAKYPNLRAYPFMTTAMSPGYNLPPEVGSATLVLTPLTMCRITRGNITHWNDSAIVADNPSLKLPGRPIIYVHVNFPNDGFIAMTRLCTKIDAVWADTIGVTSLPMLPFSGWISINRAQSTAGFGAYVLANPWTLGWWSEVASMRVPSASFINQAGKTVQPNTAAVSQAFLELAAKGIVAGGGYDLTHAQSAFAWPVSLCSWIWLDVSSVRSTCAAKGEALKFILYLYTSPVVAQIASEGAITMPPMLFLEQNGLLDRLRKEILCDGVALVGTGSSAALIQGNAMVSGPLGFLMQLYHQIDSTVVYSFRPKTDALALDRVAAGEIGFGVVSPAALTDAQIDQFVADDVRTNADGSVTQYKGGMMFPAFLVGAAITFSLPPAVTALNTARLASTTDMGLLPLLPLVMDVETLGEIFSGRVTSWTAPEMLALNPQLLEYFSRTSSPTDLRTVTCCTLETDPRVAGSLLTARLQHTAAFNTTLGVSAAASLTSATVWKALGALVPGMTVVDRETTMTPRLSLQPGSVSYKLVTAATSNPASEFLLQFTNDRGVVDTVAATPDNMKKCVAADVASPEFMRDFIANPKKRDWVSRRPGCYPITGLAALAVSATFESGSDVGAALLGGSSMVSSARLSDGRPGSACVRAQKNLEFINWIQQSPVLSSVARSGGVVRLSDFDAVRSFVVDTQLNSATCDGKTILITLPIVWSVPAGATVFSIVIAAIIILACGLTLLGLYINRMHRAIRGASPLFLAQVAIGLALIATSLIAWAAPVSESSCLTFQWLANLGFTLAFAPLFAKTWRIYQIFSAKKIKIVKISNRRLIWVVALMLAFELVILAVWTGVSPLQPVLFERATNQLDGAIEQLTHCAMVDSAGSAFIAVEASMKGALLFFGCLMGFSTRKVSESFNESQTIAWAIYNVVFSGLVVGAILLFLDTLGDTLIWLVLFLLLWIAIGTWALVFVPKLGALVHAHGGANAEHSSLGSSNKDGSISFASIAGFSRAQLLSYRTALEAQLEKVKRALGLPISVGGSVGMGGGAAGECTVLSPMASPDRDRSRKYGPGNPRTSPKCNDVDGPSISHAYASSQPMAPDAAANIGSPLLTTYVSSSPSAGGAGADANGGNFTLSPNRANGGSRTPNAWPDTSSTRGTVIPSPSFSSLAHGHGPSTPNGGGSRPTLIASEQDVERLVHPRGGSGSTLRKTSSDTLAPSAALTQLQHRVLQPSSRNPQSNATPSSPPLQQQQPPHHHDVVELASIAGAAPGQSPSSPSKASPLPSDGEADAPAASAGAADHTHAAAADSSSILPGVVNSSSSDGQRASAEATAASAGSPQQAPSSAALSAVHE